MTTQTIQIWRCDAGGCGSTAPEKADGWVSAIYTHGCPAHAALIIAHAAKVTSTTRGRGAKEKTTWYLTCACGWWPSPNFQTHTARWLHEQHRAHLATA